MEKRVPKKTWPTPPPPTLPLKKPVAVAWRCVCLTVGRRALPVAGRGPRLELLFEGSSRWWILFLLPCDGWQEREYPLLPLCFHRRQLLTSVRDGPAPARCPCRHGAGGFFVCYRRGGLTIATILGHGCHVRIGLPHVDAAGRASQRPQLLGRRRLLMRRAPDQPASVSDTSARSVSLTHNSSKIPRRAKKSLMPFLVLAISG